MFAPEMKLPKITPLLLLAGLNMSVYAAGPLKVCVETSLRGYTSNSFEVGSSINLYPDEEVRLVTGVETINPRNGISMVEVDYNGENV